MLCMCGYKVMLTSVRAVPLLGCLLGASWVPRPAFCLRGGLTTPSQVVVTQMRATSPRAEPAGLISGALQPPFPPTAEMVQR